MRVQQRRCVPHAVLSGRCRVRAVSAVPSRRGLVVRAAIAGATAIPPTQLKVERLMGEGSFGCVYQGAWVTPSGQEKVVLKRVKAKVEGAELMGQMELLLNAYAAKVAKNHCADFIGYSEVTPEESTGRLTPGLWLMWKYEGTRTLAYYMRRRDTLRALAADLEVPEETVVATVMKQLFEGLAAFHGAGLVHRDVKPLNVIFAEEPMRFKLIDLGACADLRSGTNYSPEESILDPNYCPPEQYVLPTDSPHLAKSYFKLAISPMLWAQHKPDRFDMWSAGVTLLQLAVPAMRQDRMLKKFNSEYGPKYDYDLDAWRAGSFIPNRDFEVLDGDDGAGWELAKALLRPRSIRTLVDNTVVFVNDNSQQRIGASEALRHRFMKQAAIPGSILEEEEADTYYKTPVRAGSAARGGSRGSSASSSTGQRSSSSGQVKRRGGTTSGSERETVGTSGSRKAGSTFGAAVGLWRNLTNKLFDLEANIMVQASATEKQNTVVKQLKVKAAKGQVAAEVMQQEERKLNKMEEQLNNMQDDFNTTASAVGNVLGFLGFGPTKPKTVSESVKQGTGSGSKSAASKTGSVGRAAKGSVSQPAKPPTPPAPSQPTGLWAMVQRRLTNLELKLSNQSIATEKQVFTVKKLRAGVRTGEVDDVTLRKAEAILQRMERRVNELDKDLRKTKEEATGLLGLLASTVNQARGGGTAGNKAGSNTTNTTPPATPTSTAGDTSSSQQGFWGRMFGFGGAKPADAAPVAPPQPPAAAPAPAQQAAPKAAAGPSGGGTSQVSSPSGQVDNIISSSLKFTGMAAKVAIGMASALKTDAEKVLKDLEADRQAKRQRKLAEQAFLRMLGSKEPPMQPGTPFSEVEAAFGQDSRYLAVEAAQRPLLVATFVDALALAQQRTAQQAQAKLRDMFRLAITMDSTWEEFSLKYANDPTFLAVEEPITRKAVFEEAMAALRRAEDNRLATGMAEQAYVQLLTELEPPISLDTTWQRVRPLLWRDYRYLALTEQRRRALFEEVQARATEAAASRAETMKAQADAEADSVAQMLIQANDQLPGSAGMLPPMPPNLSSQPPASASAPGPSLLDQLRKEQERLRAEYDAMERKLREMETALMTKERGSQALDGREVAVPGSSEVVHMPKPAKTSKAATPTKGSKRGGSAASSGALSSLADSLSSAGITTKRKEDGSLLFTFGAEKQARASEEASEKETVNEVASTNNKP